MKSQEFLDIKEIRKLSMSEGYKEIYFNEHSSKVISFVKEEAVYYTTLQTIIKINVYYTTGTVGISIIKGHQQQQQQRQFFRRNLEIDELKIIFKNPYIEHHNYQLKSEKGQSLSSSSLTSSTDCKQPAKRPRLLEHHPEPVKSSHVNPDEEIKDEKSAIQNQMNILKNERDTIDYKIACLQFMLVEIEHECCKEDDERRKLVAHVEAVETQTTATTLTSMPTTAQDNDNNTKRKKTPTKKALKELKLKEAEERRLKCTGLLGIRIKSIDRIDDKEDNRKRGTCEICKKRTHSYCFGCKAFLCLKLPNVLNTTNTTATTTTTAADGTNDNTKNTKNINTQHINNNEKYIDLSKCMPTTTIDSNNDNKKKNKNDEMLMLNNCWLIHHSCGINRHIMQASSSSSSSST